MLGGCVRLCDDDGVRSLLHFVPQIESMSELIENGFESMVIGILGAVWILSSHSFVSYRSKSPSGCFRRASSHVPKAESPGRDLCESCSKRSRPSEM